MHLTTGRQQQKGCITMKKKTVNTRFLVELAVLIAIELLLEITGLGYIKTGFLSFTIMQVPVIVGAIVLGPLAGAILGTAFGLTSFWECFGKDPLGVVLLGARPFSTFILCVVPRLLMGSTLPNSATRKLINRTVLSSAPQMPEIPQRSEVFFIPLSALNT